MNLDTEKIIRELSYRVSDGTPNLTNPIHILEMKIIMLESGYPVEFVSKITSIISEDTKKSFNAVSKDTEETSIFATEKARDAAIKSGTHKKWVGDDDDKASDNKEDDGRPKGAALFDTDETEKFNEPESKPSVDSNSETSKTINDKRFGVSAKAQNSLKKGYISKEEAAKVEQFKEDFEKFESNPNQKGAEELINKYQLSMNAGGNKLYLGFLAGDNRKILGAKNKLVKIMGDKLNKFVDLKSKGNASKIKTDALAGKSKPNLATRASAKNDKGVAELFSKEPYNRLKERYHQIFGPKGEDGNILRPSSKYSKEYLNQSINENTSLDQTIDLLEEQGNKEVKNAMVKHRDRMRDIAKGFVKPSEEQRKLVESSYSQMAREMHEADPDAARAIMKNVAEMALYDSELAGGDECYLPSHGSYPSGDKLRVDRNGDGVVERVAAVSVKFGKSSGGVYGFPGESAQYIKYHPDEEKRDLLKNRVGYPGYSLGVKEEHINDPEKFNKLIEEGELSEMFKDGGAEKIRLKLVEIQKKINARVDKLPKPLKKKALVNIRKKLDGLNGEAAAIIAANIDPVKAEKLLGKHNAREIMKGGAHAANIIVMAACIKTSGGLSNIEHNHQVINESGLESKTEKGSDDLTKWKFMGRFTDNRGGGLQGAYIGSGGK
jgi:hypothetical protein